MHEYTRHTTMEEVRDEIWALLAKYLCGEATSSECHIVEILLNENAAIRTFYQQIEQDFIINEKVDKNNPIMAFSKLDERIKKSNQREK
jgi:hypothetical protein